MLTMEEAAMKHTLKRQRTGNQAQGSLSLLERIQPDAAGSLGGASP